jgi:fatty acid desaturase
VSLSTQGSIAGSFWFAIFGWLLGALGHDAGHFAASRTAWVNEWGVWGMSLIGNPVMWQHQHTYAHHSQTNDFDHDPDLHHFTQFFLRAHKNAPYVSKYQYQSKSWYIVIAYLFAAYGLCINLPFDLWCKGVEFSGALRFQDRDRPGKAIGYHLHFASYIFFILVLPVFTHASPWKGFVAGLVHMTTVGLTFAMFSQINHITEDCVTAGLKHNGPKDATTAAKSNATATEEDELKKKAILDSWAVAQVETSNNFAPDSWVWHIISNGLNLQIEHHLFPGLNHCHLHHIMPVVRKTCEEYGVSYKCYANWTELWEASLAWYDKLSINDDIIAAKSTE